MMMTTMMVTTDSHHIHYSGQLSRRKHNHQLSAFLKLWHRLYKTP